MLYLKTKLRQLKWRWRNRRSGASSKLTGNADIFSRIYAQNEWGKTLNQKGENRFFSGSGSHDTKVVSNYVEAIRNWSLGFETRLSALDVGCGDFNIGSALLPYFRQYTAADVVPELIEHNQEKWRDVAVEFIQLDIANDALPYADVVLVREVFQHLSNDDIKKAIQNIKNSCKYLILTESRPGAERFVANLDKPTGIGTRSQFGSGVDVLQPPFSLACKSADLLLRQPRGERRLDTIVYEMP